MLAEQLLESLCSKLLAIAELKSGLRERSHRMSSERHPTRVTEKHFRLVVFDESPDFFQPVIYGLNLTPNASDRP